MQTNSWGPFSSIPAIRSATPNGRDWRKLKGLVTENEKNIAHHQRIVVLHTFTKSQRQITNRLGTALHANGLVVRERMHLTCDSRVLDHCPGVGGETWHGATDVRVDFHDFFDGRGFEEGRRDTFLNGEHGAVGCGNTDCCGTKLRLWVRSECWKDSRYIYLDRFHSILD